MYRFHAARNLPNRAFTANLAARPTRQPVFHSPCFAQMAAKMRVLPIDRVVAHPGHARCTMRLFAAIHPVSRSVVESSPAGALRCDR
jgi:hypothetical protein